MRVGSVSDRSCSYSWSIANTNSDLTSRQFPINKIKPFPLFLFLCEFRNYKSRMCNFEYRLIDFSVAIFYLLSEFQSDIVIKRQNKEHTVHLYSCISWTNMLLVHHMHLLVFCCEPLWKTYSIFLKNVSLLDTQICTDWCKNKTQSYTESTVLHFCW